MRDRELGSKDRSAWVRLRSSGARADAREEKDTISRGFFSDVEEKGDSQRSSEDVLLVVETRWSELGQDSRLVATGRASDEIRRQHLDLVTMGGERLTEPGGTTALRLACQRQPWRAPCLRPCRRRSFVCPNRVAPSERSN